MSPTGSSASAGRRRRLPERVPEPDDTADPGFESQLGTWFLRSPIRQCHGPDDHRLLGARAGSERRDLGHRGAPQRHGRAVGRRGIRCLGRAGLVPDQPLGASTIFEPLDGSPGPSRSSASTSSRSGSGTSATPGGVGLAFNNFNATTAIPGPTLLTHQPDLPVERPGGRAPARLYWSEPVTSAPPMSSVLTHDAIGQPVPFTVEGSGTQVTTITFTGEPGRARHGRNRSRSRSARTTSSSATRPGRPRTTRRSTGTGTASRAGTRGFVSHVSTSRSRRGCWTCRTSPREGFGRV
jgi:hypothetical protein